MNTTVNNLNNLRQTIMERDWKESYQKISTLFAQDVPAYTVFIAEQMLRSSLRFQFWYDLEWIPEYAQGIVRFIREGNAENKAPKLPDEAYGTFTDAPFGVGSLVGGVIELRNSLSVAKDAGEKAKCLVYALDHFIVSEISDYWYKIYPEEIRIRERFFNAETGIERNKDSLNDSDRKKLYRGVGFLKQPESIGYRIARLLSVVDEIELMLNK